MRCVARATILGGLVFASATVSAAGWLIMTSSVETFLVDAGKVLGGVFVVVMGLFGVAKGYNTLFLEPQFQAMEERQQRMIEAGLVLLEKSFQKILDHHVVAVDPHPGASDRMHTPLYEADQKILAAVEELRVMRKKDSDRINKLIHAHNVTIGAQQHALDAISCLGRRDPKATPFPRRDGDPKDADFTPQRGHAHKTLLEIEEDDEP